jgi:hypothetical protein
VVCITTEKKGKKEKMKEGRKERKKKEPIFG